MPAMEKITEQPSHYRHLERMSTLELLQHINAEDKTVPFVVEKAIPAIARLAEAVFEKLSQGGRLFYIGAGTSGRLGILDASECPPTFGVPYDMVIGLIAGGDTAIRRAVEHAEDSYEQAWRDLQDWHVDPLDIVVGIAASGTTPYVVGGVRECKAHGILTGCITCNPGTPLAALADFPVEVITGPEFVTGSTRMKAGTATKLVLNMLSTTVMIRLGRVEDNKMVDMQLANDKLLDRGTRMVAQDTGLPYDEARRWLIQYGSVRNAVRAFREKHGQR
ncbi:MAG: N-acetylmuramic acid 6-phosphate etherase [Saprospiraceae bacterium]|nr:MAG: N-acetylmuramic acid 6-phosphate etherase [Saprospiraceae bacterium]